MKNAKIYITVIFCAICINLSFGQTNLKVELNENIELLTVIQYLGDRGVYPMNSIYLREVDTHFKSLTKHDAVKKIKEIFPKNAGDASFPQIGAYCTTLPELKINYSLKKFKDSIQIPGYVNLCREFSKKSDFRNFFNNQNFKIDLWRQQVVDTINHYSLTERLEEFMGRRMEWNIYLSPLVGWGAYNFSIPNGNENNEIHFVLGYNPRYNKDDKSAMNEQPFFAQKDILIDLIWHEGSHSYITPLIENDKEFISTYSKLVTSDMHEQLQKAGRFDWSWEYYLNEVIVRAIVAKLLYTHFDEKSGMTELENQKNNGFHHIERVFNLLTKYEQTDKKGITYFFELLKQDLNNW